jgi:hypothetical protein
MRDRNLYEALMDFPLSQTGGELTFLDRLCRENNWPYDLGSRAIHEYKRFVYLAMVSPMPVTPSDEVDQVWHLHLLYTRSYWEQLNRILPRPLHHGPTAGGQEEDEKFNDWYERTKALYQSEFGEEAPADLWPSAAARFNPRQRFRRLDVATHWVIPKPSLQLRRSAAAFAAMPLAVALMAASGGLEWVAIVLFLWVAIVILILAFSVRRRPRRQTEGGAASDGGGGCSSGSSCSSFFTSCGSGDSGGGDSGGDGGSGCGGCGGGD